FEITVSDPHKIGDAMSAHVVYKVHTKTSQPGFDSEEYSVRRRYRDFEWLFNQLASTHPGVVIPPMPEKQSLGRFQDDFVESRRFALEKYLRKISVHSLLQADDDFKIFLTSENFTIETRVRRPETSRGFFGVFGEVMSGSFSKYSETDEWFENRKDQLDALESQLRSLLKAIDTTIKQRKELAVAHGEFGQALRALGEAEASPQLARSFEIFSELQDHLRQLQERQASFDVKTFESTTDEYIRTIGSIKLTLTARVKAYQVWQADAAELHRKTSSYDRLRNQTRFRTDRTSQLQAEIGQLEIQTENHRHEFEDISTLIRAELERFDREKVLDFKESAEQFLSSMVDHQQKVIRLWEAYL
ncbi:Vps5 C terminal like-domain-containing protein, partial [Dimargaris cristalligena]